MTSLGAPSFLQRRKYYYAQYSPPWSTPLWLAAFSACMLDHFYCSSVHGQDISQTAPSYVAAVRRLFALFVELCLMCSNTGVMFHIVYRGARRRPDNSIGAYLCPIITFLLLTAINGALFAVPMIVPAALVTATPTTELHPAYYHYSPSLLFLTYGVALSLVALAIAAGTVLSWGFGQASDDKEALLAREESLGLTWGGQHADTRP